MAAPAVYSDERLEAENMINQRNSRSVQREVRHMRRFLESSVDFWNEAKDRVQLLLDTAEMMKRMLQVYLVDADLKLNLIRQVITERQAEQNGHDD